MEMRNEKMAEDLRECISRHSEVVFFAGDDHIDPVRNILDGEAEIIEDEQSRP
jgi:hypothetical protein